MMFQSSKIFWLGLVLLETCLCLKTTLNELSQGVGSEEIAKKLGDYMYYFNNDDRNFYIEPTTDIGSIKQLILVLRKIIFRFN